MSKINEEFLESFKRAEKLCSDMYGEAHGITVYINNMERAMAQGAGTVPGWRDYYNTLKHIRWVRNNLVHEVNPNSASSDDLRSIRNFYDDVLNRRDPLALLKKHAKSYNYSLPRRKTAVCKDAVKYNASARGGARRMAPKNKGGKLQRRSALLIAAMIIIGSAALCILRVKGVI